MISKVAQVKLDAKEAKIWGYLAKGIRKRSIAKPLSGLSSEEEWL